jgi:hypothetical protein
VTLNGWLKVGLIAILAFAGPACADLGLIGEYAGRLKQVDGYKGQPGDECTVSIRASDLYGGGLSFAINDQETIVEATKDVAAAMEAGDPLVKINAQTSFKPQGAEYVTMKLGGDRTLRFLKLMRKFGRQHLEKSIACGDLTKQ